MSQASADRRARALWRALLVCSVLGALAFVAARVLDRPRHGAGERPNEAGVPPGPLEQASRTGTPPEALHDPGADTPRQPGDDGTQAGRVVGTITSRRAGPLPGVEIELALARGSSAAKLGTVVSGADGHFTYAGESLRSALGTEAVLVVSARPAGHAPVLARYSLESQDPARALQVELVLDGGALVSGRVVTALGGPVERASVRLWVRSKSGAVATFVKAGDVETGADGRFALPFESSATYRATARAHGLGTAAIEDLVLASGTDRDVGDVALHGSAPIEGRITAPDGAPVPALEVWAIDSAYAGEPDALSRAALRESDDERGDGLAWTRTVTDEQGRYALGGLRPGHYALRAPDPLVVLEPHQARYEPPQTGVDLVVHSQRLLVHVQDPRGMPVGGAAVRLTEISTRLDGSFESSGTRARGVNANTGTADFVVDPEVTMSVIAFQGKRVGPEELVQLARNEWTRELTLVLPDQVGRGRLRLSVVGEDSLPLASLWVSVLSAATRIPREDLGTLESDGTGLLPDLPEGRYHLAIGYAPGTDRDHFPVRTQAPVEVRSGVVTDLALVARAGGRVRIRLDVEGAPPPDLERGEKLPDRERRDRFGARLALVPAGRTTPIPLQFRPASGAGLASSILPGENLFADTLLERGEYTVVLDAGAFVLEAETRLVVAPQASNELVLRAQWR